MNDNVKKIPANQEEIALYCYTGEALWKIQIVEQALNCSITLKMNPDETKERADEFLKQHQSYTLGKAIKIANDNKLYSFSIQEELNSFLIQRNWLIHKALCENQDDFNLKNKKEGLFKKIKSISDKAEFIHRELEYDLIHFCTSKGRNMTKILSLLKLQEQGIRITSNHLKE